jgi:hypothetical protein
VVAAGFVVVVVGVVDVVCVLAVEVLVFTVVRESLTSSSFSLPLSLSSVWTSDLLMSCWVLDVEIVVGLLLVCGLSGAASREQSVCVGACVCACVRARVCVCVCVCASVQGMCLSLDTVSAVIFFQTPSFLGLCVRNL